MRTAGRQCHRTRGSDHLSRNTHLLNDGWLFHPNGLSFAERTSTADSAWQRVSIPHTWNAADPFDDVQGYRRGIAWYRRQLVVPDSLKGRRLFLHFEGVNQGVLIPDHTPEMTCDPRYQAQRHWRIEGKLNRPFALSRSVSRAR